MADVVTRLPARRPGLVSSPAAENGRYLLRNRRTGESFRLGEEEHFLLERLDGLQSGEEICRSFTARFGELLSEEDLDEFVELATRRGLLLAGGENGSQAEYPVLSTADSVLPAQPVRRPLWKRAGSRTLKLVSKLLGWPGRILSAAAWRIDMLRLRRLDFVPRPDDVFVVTYPRSGTHWMAMILYQLTSDGNMDFPHINEYCPWFAASGRSAQGFQDRPSPRLFKTHLPYQKLPKGLCRYIYVARNPKDMLVSYYHYRRNYRGFQGAFDELFDEFLNGKPPHGSWFEHVKGWWAHRDDPNVLFLTYEELSRDLEGCIRRIADFIGREVPSERMPGIVERSSFTFMKQHENKFDPAMDWLWEQGVQLSTFLRHGRVGEGTVRLTAGQQAQLDEALNERLRGFGACFSITR